MARKPAKMYRRLKGPAYTRRKYIGGVPNNRIMQFHVGNRRAAETGEFLMELNLIADESCQIRHTALEAARVISNSTIRKAAGAQNYALRITHTLITSFVKTSRQLVLVLTVFLKECAVHSERTLEPLQESSVDRELFLFNSHQNITWLLRMLCARLA